MSYEPIGTLDAIPSWAVPDVCADCGDAIFGSQGSVWSSADPHNHRHTDCERAAVYVERLSVIDTLRHSALVEAGNILGSLICECDPENWNDEVATAVFAALKCVDEGKAAAYTAGKPHEVAA